MKKKVYVISHSHLDREWYLPYEQHHMRVIELFDALIQQFETDQRFRYFHLDGQTIPLDDYFEVKPENKALIESYIKAGKLRIGPFYILQDVFLTSAEANTRNAIIGITESKKYGQYVQLGYFPDTFGNMGQTPQFLRKLGLDTAAFGRGVTPTGFNNTVANNYASQYSEMNWVGPDGSKILGVLFANWYSNGNEIPVEREAASVFWEKKLKEVEAFAATNHLLMMNGCDHQPLQRNIGAAIALANELFPEYEFVHSHFDDYLEAVKQELPTDLATVEGELTSQATPGWYTLANTASSRIYLKQENVKTQVLLENIAEPLAVMAKAAAGNYPKSELLYAWKLLLQNHPHDSICGCSVDQVHQEMMIRYRKSQEVAKYIQEEALTKLAAEICTQKFPQESYPFSLYNTSSSEKTEVVQVKLELERIPFSDAYPTNAFKALGVKDWPTVKVLDEEQQECYFEVDDSKVEFNYELPKDSFRNPYMARYIYLSVYVEKLPAFSWKTFALVKGDEAQQLQGSLVKADQRSLENDFLFVEIAQNGSLTITDKQTGKRYSDCLIFEDVGDIGNEYIFKQANENAPLLSTDFAYQLEIVKDTPVEAKVKLTHAMEIPIAAGAELMAEQQSVTDITNRKAQRSKTCSLFEITTVITITKGCRHLKFETHFNNQQKDHRLRVLFRTGLLAATHTAESIFEAVERPNQVSPEWENPANPQHQHAFVNLKNQQQTGVTIGNIGLNEYEILPDKGNTIALTLLRSVGEMGDWGYFPTPEAQCLGKQTVRYSFEPHSKDSYFKSLQTAIAEKIPLSIKQLKWQTGKLPATNQIIEWDNTAFTLTALKQSEDQTGIVLRGYSMNNEETERLNLTLNGLQGKEVNLLEENSSDFSKKVVPAEILTLKFAATD